MQVCRSKRRAELLVDLLVRADLTFDHTLWVVTERLNSCMRAAEISLSVLEIARGAQSTVATPLHQKKPAEVVQHLIKMPLGQLLRRFCPAGRRSWEDHTERILLLGIIIFFIIVQVIVLLRVPKFLINRKTLIFKFRCF